MKIGTFVWAMLLGAALLLLTGYGFKKTILRTDDCPSVLASSISPDKKWICEIVDVHPNPYVCLALVHVGVYRGANLYNRGYLGEAYVADFDSSSLPADLAFTWDNDILTIDNFETTPIKFKLSQTKTETGNPTGKQEIISSPARR